MIAIEVLHRLVTADDGVDAIVPEPRPIQDEAHAVLGRPILAWRRSLDALQNALPFTAMSQDEQPVDYYELLQVSPNAETETISRTYRMLAQRYHPDNQTTGSESRFRELHQAFTVLSDPEQRAKYDISYQRQRQDRWRLVSAGAQSEDDFAVEQMFRLTMLEALYTKRRSEPDSPSLYSTELETMLGRTREHLSFTIWYLIQKKLITRDDQSRLVITAEGVEHLEENYRATLHRRRLPAAQDPQAT